jgi:hypothetical protein
VHQEHCLQQGWLPQELRAALALPLGTWRQAGPSEASQAAAAVLLGAEGAALPRDGVATVLAATLALRADAVVLQPPALATAIRDARIAAERLQAAQQQAREAAAAQEERVDQAKEAGKPLHHTLGHLNTTTWPHMQTRLDEAVAKV